MNKRLFRLVNRQARDSAVEAIKTAPDGFFVVVQEATRSLDQNAAQWPILEAIAAQTEWNVNGEMVKLDKSEVKEILSAAFHQETVRLAQGLNGGVVMLGRRTSEFRKGEFSEWLEFLHSVAADRNVRL